MDDKSIRRCSVHPGRSQIPTVMAMSITTDNLLPRPKLNCDVGYDAAVKGASIVVYDNYIRQFFCKNMATIYFSLLS